VEACSSRLPAELLVQVLSLLSVAADFGRAATSCAACCNALEQAVRAHSLRRGLQLDARAWLQLSPFRRIRMPWAYMLRVAESRPRVLEATLAATDMIERTTRVSAPLLRAAAPRRCSDLRLRPAALLTLSVFRPFVRAGRPQGQHLQGQAAHQHALVGR
jgi:hypothetical protein